MAAELLEENLTQPEQTATAEPAPAAEPEAAVEQPAGPEQEAQDPGKEPEKPKKKRELLIPVLAVLLVLLGLGEAVFWGGFGLASYRSSLARERYEAQRKALEEERAASGVLGGSAYGPNLKVENGAVTWEREKWVSQGSNLTERPQVNRRDDGLRLSWLSVPRIPYYLAEMAEDMESPDEPEEPASEPEPEGDENVPTSA